MRRLLLVLLPLTACSCAMSHPSLPPDDRPPSADSGVASDAGVAPAPALDAAAPLDAGSDAGPPAERAIWQRLDRDGSVRELTEDCAIAADSHRIFEVATGLYDVCEEVGPTRVEWLDTHRVRLTPTVWREERAEPGVEPCEFTNDQELRVVSLRMPADGAPLTVEGPGGERVLQSAGGSAACGGAGGVDAACTQSCDCDAGLVCIPTVTEGDFRFCRDAPGRCGLACAATARADGRFGCAAAQRCEAASDGAAGRCVAHAGDCSPSADMCPPGMSCAGSPADCLWSAEPQIGGRCGACGEGADCVRDASGDRRCAVRCSNANARCPEGFACAEPSGTCERERL